MHIIPTNYSVAEYCAGMLRKEIVVNREYQRSDKVWPPAARSFLVETILLGYPIPKLSLYQVTDIKSRKTMKEIVDGQQRSLTILDFYNDKFHLPKRSGVDEGAGKAYSELSEELQQAFLNYSLSADLFVSAAPGEIREVFRRINSYTVPLNPEEQRHATYQGLFKWFIYRLTRTYDQTFVNVGVFGEKQLVRMADAKLFSETIHALLNGINTTNKKMLDDLYRDRDEDFPEEQELQHRIDEAMSFMLGIEDIHNGPLMKPYNFYSLLLAICHAKQPVEQLSVDCEVAMPYVYNKDIVRSNLTSLAEALEDPDNPGRFGEFVKASLEKTNVAQYRKIRLIWLCRALQQRLL
jgi:hypothetical protein